jgi:HEAT repeat protein
LKRSTHGLLCIILSCEILTGVAYGQVVNPPADKLAYAADKTNVPDAIKKVKSGDFLLVHISMIADAGAVEAIPALKEQFALSQDWITKDKIASALVKLGDKDGVYWGFLLKQATAAVESDAPNIVTFDSKGKIEPGPPPQLTAWAKAHNLSLEAATEEVLFNIPGKVMLLADAEDLRGIPFLRQALLSNNFLIQNVAASGLAKVHDKDSVPLIIEACKGAPPELAKLLAESLESFDDPQAQAAVTKYVPPDQAEALRKTREQANHP